MLIYQKSESHWWIQFLLVDLKGKSDTVIFQAKEYLANPEAFAAAAPAAAESAAPAETAKEEAKPEAEAEESDDDMVSLYTDYEIIQHSNRNHRVSVYSISYHCRTISESCITP